MSTKHQIQITQVYSPSTSSIQISGICLSTGKMMHFLFEDIPREYCYHVSGWTKKEYLTHTGGGVLFHRVESRRNFFFPYTAREFLVGYTKSTENNPVKKLPSSTQEYNTNLTLLDQVRAQRTFLFPGQCIEVSTNSAQLHHVSENTYHFSKDGESIYQECKEVKDANVEEVLWNVSVLHCTIEECTRREEPVANWTYVAEKFNMSPIECQDEPTQRILRIHWQEFHLPWKILKNSSDSVDIDSWKSYLTYSLETPAPITSLEEEGIMVKEFIEGYYSKKRNNNTTPNILLCWKYEESLGYIRDRYLFHFPTKTVEFLPCRQNRRLTWKDSEEEHQRMISVEFERFDTPQEYLYISLFHFQRCLHRFKSGYDLSIFFEQNQISANRLSLVNIGLLHCFIKNKHLPLVLSAQELFLMDCKSILGPFWKNLYRHLYTYVVTHQNKLPYVFRNYWHGKEEESYVGGLVFESIQEITHENCLPFDIISSYPSAMCEKNICFTTRYLPTQQKKRGYEDMSLSLSSSPPCNVIHLLCKSGEKKNTIITNGTGENDMAYFVKQDIRQGVLPLILGELMKKRSILLKSDPRTAMIKFYINRIYGMFFSGSIFHSREIARSITTIGQESLNFLNQSILKTLQHYRGEIIAGDTDGIMVRLDVSEKEEFSTKVCTTFQELSKYQYIRVRCDAVLRCVYFLNKKNYFGLLGDNKTLVEKGSEGVRKDRCYLTKKVCQFIEKQMLLLPALLRERGDTAPDWAKTHRTALYQHVLKMIREGKQEGNASSLQEDNYTFGKHRFITPTKKEGSMVSSKIENEVIPKTQEYFEMFDHLLCWLLDSQ